MAEERIRTGGQSVSSDRNMAKRKGRMRAALADKKEQLEDSGQTPKDTLREVLETLVFVVILVLLLKTFVAEAFVIPTGSMANTLFGHHEKETCPKCKFSFRVNASKEIDAKVRQRVVRCSCPNCRFHFIRKKYRDAETQRNYDQ